jgi:inositol oxygenase
MGIRGELTGREQHTKQTVEFNIEARRKAFEKPRATLGIWEAMELLNTLVDASDPDTDATQIEHLLQTSEAMRKDGKPEWMQVTGLIHDLGKLLYFFGSDGQWDVVGDTFVVGCQIPTDKIVYSDTFVDNPDLNHETYSTKYGIYEPACGLEKLMISWGHDEYLVRHSQTPKTQTDDAVYGLQGTIEAPTGSTQHDPIPLLLPLAPREGIHLFRERSR